jgi:hypothetical protein
MKWRTEKHLARRHCSRAELFRSVAQREPGTPPLSDTVTADFIAHQLHTRPHHFRGHASAVTFQYETVRQHARFIEAMHGAMHLSATSDSHKRDFYQLDHDSTLKWTQAP